MKTKSVPVTKSATYNFSFIQVAILVAMVALIVIPLFSSSSASSLESDSRAGESPAFSGVRGAITGANHRTHISDLATDSDSSLTLGSSSRFGTVLQPLLQDPGEITTFAADCTTPKTVFVLGETVCAKATGLVGYRFGWVDPAGYIEQRTDITTDPQTDTFTLPISQTSIVNDVTVDNRGEWRVTALTTRNSVRTAFFTTVRDPANAAADLSITKTFAGGTTPVAGGPVQFAIIIKNNGPDDAADVHFVDDTFTNMTLDSVTQTGGPAFVCEPGSTVDCTLALLPNGGESQFLLNFTAGSAGSTVVNTATVSSTTAEKNAVDNSFTTETLTIGSGAPPPSCELACPNNMNAVADTEEGGQRGTHVTFAAATSEGTCGAITASPASGSFFPVGTTTVVVTSEEGGGNCSFTVTVTDTGANPPTISCPSNQTGTADANCSASISVGTASATGDNVTVIGSRSDGQAMYTCDENGTNCTRNSSDAPFATGVTTITWIAFSHDVAGPYASAEDEEAHRTGSASCTQTVTVDDVTAPTINAPPQTVAADASCQAAIPDYSNTATDNCACASSDTSEVCNERSDIVVTQSIPAGTLVGPGTHTITLTANDGSSNNGGAGNESTTTTTFTVVDETDPVISCQSNITTGTDPDSCTATVDPGTATATDNCDTSVTITGTRSDSQALNAPYPKGTTTITWTATDDAGNSSSCQQTVTVNDDQPPAITCPSNITVFLPLNSPATSMAVTYPAATVSDNCPGATVGYSVASGSVFPVGTTTVTATATDAAGLTSSCSFTVTVLYNFTGFFAPVDNPPTLNKVNAGRAIPVKFSLSGNKGLDIFADNSPYTVGISCDGSAPQDDIEETLTAGSSSLSYQSGSDQYIYVWKTESSWAGTCRQLVVKLNDGSEHTALFKFQ